MIWKNRWLLLILAIVATLYFFGFAVGIILTMNIPSGQLTETPFVFQYFSFGFYLHLLFIFEMVLTFALYVLNVLGNKTIGKIERALWLSVIVLLNVVGMYIYWFARMTGGQDSLKKLNKTTFGDEDAGHLK